MAHVPQAKVEALLVGLVRRRLLVTDLRPPMTCTDPVRHVTARLDPTQATLDVNNGGSAVVDLRIGLDLVVPDIVMRAAEAAGRALTLLTAHPGGLPAWVAWHEAFLERYGPGALVPVTEVTDPAVGLGLPATFRGADRTVADPGSLERDRRLAALVQDAVLHGAAEIALFIETMRRVVGESMQAEDPVTATAQLLFGLFALCGLCGILLDDLAERAGVDRAAVLAEAHRLNLTS